LKTYLYTSIPELNAVLKPYNVLAGRGSADSRIFQTGGLVYRVPSGQVKEGNSACIYADNFLKEADQLNFHEKIIQV
jgi:hypothetical protein